MEHSVEVQYALRWWGFPPDAEVDYCEDGSAYVGLTQILPKGTFANGQKQRPTVIDTCAPER